MTAMRKAWFVYELGSKGPNVAIYYDDLPNKKNGLNRTILQKHELNNQHYFNSDNEIDVGFDFLSKTFPYTGDHYDIGEKVKLEAAETIAVAAE